MNSYTTSRFRQVLAGLPADVQRRARAAYRLFKRNPFHPSLGFKQVHPQKPIYSVRIGIDYRAVGVRDRGEILWYWIGSHANYDKLIAHL